MAVSLYVFVARARKKKRNRTWAEWAREDPQNAESLESRHSFQGRQQNISVYSVWIQRLSSSFFSS